MNKLLTKIVGVALGATMAVGVSLAAAKGAESNMKRADADASSITFVTSPTNLSYSSGTANNKSMTSGGVTITFSQITAKNGDKVQLAKNGTITSTAFGGTITGVTINGYQHTASTKSDGDFYVKGSSNGTTFTDVEYHSGLSYSIDKIDTEFDETDEYSYFQILNGNNRVLQLTSIVVSFESDGGGGDDPDPETYDITIDFTTTTDNVSASTTELVYAHTVNNVTATATALKNNSSTNTNNYYPGTSGKSYTHTRFYTNSTLEITATNSSSVSMYITSVVINANTTSYATTMNGFTWSNVASKSVDSKAVSLVANANITSISTTVGGTCGVDSIVVTWSSEPVSSPIIEVVSTLTVGTTMTKTVDVAFANLSSDISLSVNNASISLSKNTIVNSGSSDTFVVTAGANSGNSTITLTSGTVVKEIAVTIQSVTAYTLVDNSDDLSAGTTFVLTSADGTSVASTFSSTLYASGESQLNDSDHKVRSLVASEFTLEGSAGDWMIKHGEKYVGITSNEGNKLTEGNTASTNAYKWTIESGEDDTIVITNKQFTTQVIQFNSGSNRFTNYGGTQQSIKMYAVLAPALVVGNTTATIDTGASTTTTITAVNFGGAVSYSIVSSDSDVVTGSISGTTLTISGGSKSGTETLTITGTYSSQSASVVITVTVNTAGREFIGIYSTIDEDELFVGEAFSFSGTIYALYSDESEEDVTSSCTFTGYDMSQEDAYEVTVTYTEESSDNTTTYTLYVELFPYVKATSINGGDRIIISYESAEINKNLTGISTTSTKYGLASDYATYPSTTYTLDVVAGSADGSVAFKTSDNKYLTWTSGNTLNVANDISANSSWELSFEDGIASIMNVSTKGADKPRYLSYNTSSPRFACYENGTANITIWKLNGSSGQAAATSFAEDFYDDVVTDVCAAYGPSFAEDMPVAWELYAGAYAELSPEAKSYIASKTANASGDAVEKMLFEYKHIYDTYGEELELTNFLGRVEAAKAASSRIIRPINNANSTVAIIIVTTISLVSVSALGAYFLLRKKKEER